MRLRTILPVVVLLIMVGGCTSIIEHPTAATAAAPALASTQPAARLNFINARAILILRHADINPADKATMGMAAPLTDRGRERAKELAWSLKDAGVTRIITTEAVRTKDTAAALATELGIPSEVVNRRGPIEGGMTSASESDVVIDHLAKIARPTDVILLVHHHSTLPGILTKIGYPREPHYDDATEFDRMYVVLPDSTKGTYKVIRARFRGPENDH